LKKTLSIGFLLVAVLLVAVLLTALSAGPVLGGNHDSNVEKAKKAQKGLNGKVLPKKDVVGTAIGAKGGALVLRVFTAKKGVAGIPKKQDDFDVVVTVTGPISALGPQTGTALLPRATHTTSRLRPVPIGVSTGHFNITAGTIGAWVTDGTNDFALSNNHVYADENNASVGDNVLQPGPYDGGVNPSDAIATLSDFEHIHFNNFGQCLMKRKRCNEIDAAIAVVSSGIVVDYETPAGGYGTPNETSVAAVLGQAVQKYGRTTSLTKGTITGINATVNVGYSSGDALFVDQIIVEDTGAFIQGGDSGSLLVTDDAGLNPVGLLYAGNGDGTFAVANHIDVVLARFGVTVDDGDGAVQPNNPPSVSITSPADGSTFSSGATISFAGSASDTEDGDLTASLVWTSDIDGQIGTGGSFDKVLSDGNHNITASVTDSGDASSSDSISVTVGSVGQTTMIVEETSFSTKTNKKGKVTDLILNVTVTESDQVTPVAGAEVSVEITSPDGVVYAGAGLTNSQGKVGFSPAGKLKAGTWTGAVTSVTKNYFVLDTTHSDLTADITL